MTQEQINKELISIQAESQLLSEQSKKLDERCYRLRVKMGCINTPSPKRGKKSKGDAAAQQALLDIKKRRAKLNIKQK